MFSSVFLFFDIGGGEIMLIMLVVLLLFGGEKLPQLARGLGKGIRDFKDASEGVKREITNQIDSFEAKKADQANAAPTTTETAAAAPVVAATEPPVITPAPNTMPVAEISSTAEVAPVHHEPNTPAEPAHLRETPIESLKSPQEEVKS
ncbi:Sec-independent protein translocase subunit TatA/TatB [Mucilaginibacter sp. X5P1]|uniref:Sec-independent protein translocase subunit TatA/TatB n=1 Tax=Mucilaginibacter sp. X5P1 TaxID=2723088 RepID=UPI0017EA09BF|nr:twin-arginine translocase TatA/TatE family subunit [Mucilaginibacter sp. X5P1]MBB6138948.1 sec-independent protein translocase protein TatA [Mucilaginibacter sp. X5P1]